MKSINYLFSASLLLGCLWVTASMAADLAAGEQKAESCVSCHGPKGKSSNPQWPNLAAQQPGYQVIQLKAFKAGDRSNPMMQAMATNLSNEDMDNLAAYFAKQEPARAGGNPELATSGKSKAGMCLGCHGSSAEGNGQFPRLAGQHPEYLVAQLKSFKENKRQNGQMQAIAANLSENDMKELAAYFGSL
ncbi:MAG: c-type cytochrome [Methylococcaceae bacterium]